MQCIACHVFYGVGFCSDGCRCCCCSCICNPWSSSSPSIVASALLVQPATIAVRDPGANGLAYRIIVAAVVIAVHVASSVGGSAGALDAPLLSIIISSSTIAGIAAPRISPAIIVTVPRLIHYFPRTLILKHRRRGKKRRRRRPT